MHTSSSLLPFPGFTADIPRKKIREREKSVFQIIIGHLLIFFRPHSSPYYFLNEMITFSFRQHWAYNQEVN